MFSVKRSPNNPIFGPDRAHFFESFAAFNMSVVKVAGKGKDKKIFGIYRAISAKDPLATPSQMSTIGIAESADGVHFKNRRQFLAPQEAWERYGCEDPRVTYFEGVYYTFYTALSTYPFGASGIKVAVAISSDLKEVTERHLVTPFNAKAMTLFPERINGKITVMLSVDTDKPPAKIAIAQVDDIEELWSENFWSRWYAQVDKHMIDDPRRTEWDHIEVGAPLVKTPHGWLLIYSHIQNYFPNPQHWERIFGIEALLLDLKDPRKIISHTKGAMLAPNELYELIGDVSNVIFPSGALLDGNMLNIYYGAADTTTCVAQLCLDDLLATMVPAKVQELTGKQVGFVRPPHNPILLPIKEHKWEAQAVLNPAAIELAGRIYILYRAFSDDATSTIGLAISKDGLTIDERLPEPIYVPREDFEKKRGPNMNSGCEDARIMKIGDKLYITYTAYDGIDVPRVAISSISESDFLDRKWNWSKPILVSPPGVDDKDAAIFPEKMTVTLASKKSHKYLFLHRVNGEICADYLDSLDFKGGEINKCIPVLAARPGMWDSSKVGISSPPIKTPYGWVMLYHGISKQHNTYRVGAALLDLDDPTIVISRLSDPILEPATDYEKMGIVNGVVFPCGTVVKDGILYVYYGAADLLAGVASMDFASLVSALRCGVEFK